MISDWGEWSGLEWDVVCTYIDLSTHSKWFYYSKNASKANQIILCTNWHSYAKLEGD